MGVIKITDEIKNDLDTLKTSITDYEEGVSSSLAAIEQCSESLKGDSYSKFIASVQSRVNEQITMAGEVLAFQDLIHEYIDQMLETESSAPFPT